MYFVSIVISQLSIRSWNQIHIQMWNYSKAVATPVKSEQGTQQVHFINE